MELSGNTNVFDFLNEILNERAHYYESLLSKMDASLKDKIMTLWPGIKKDTFKTRSELKKFITEKPEDMSKYHFGLGLYLRNNYLTPDSEIYMQFVENGIPHLDDMSSIIIYLFQKRLRQGKIK